jgi:hypothetical protein
MDSQELTVGKPWAISPGEVADLQALCDRHAETGEVFSYDPASRRVEVIHTPAARAPEPFYLGRAPEHRQPIVHVPARRERPREHRAPARGRARAPTSDDPSPESDPPLRVIPPAAFRRELAERGLGVPA